MSNTFKTDPIWVKIHKPSKPNIVREYHDHRNSECDLHKLDKRDPFLWRRRWNGQNCALSVSYYGYHGGFYARPPRGKEIRNLMEGAVRANWRKQRDDILKLSTTALTVLILCGTTIRSLGYYVSPLNLTVTNKNGNPVSNNMYGFFGIRTCIVGGCMAR